MAAVADALISQERYTGSFVLKLIEHRGQNLAGDFAERRAATCSCIRTPEMPTASQRRCVHSTGRVRLDQIRTNIQVGDRSWTDLSRRTRSFLDAVSDALLFFRTRKQCPQFRRASNRHRRSLLDRRNNESVSPDARTLRLTTKRVRAVSSLSTKRSLSTW